jgi:aerobic carbon-monoxide dehydrogenase medium subunit
MRPLDYRAPGSVEETLDLLQRSGDGATLLAGGQSLLILLRQGLVTPEVLVGLKRVRGLDGITAGPDTLSLGSMVTYATAAGDPRVAERAQLVGAAAGQVGSVHIRNLGTLGGSLCHADPAGDVPTVLLALDAVLHTVSPGGAGARHGIDDFFRGLFETRLEPGELLVSIEVPAAPSGATFGYRRFSYRSGEYPMAVAACRLAWEDGQCTGARVAVGGAGEHPRRLPELEGLLEGIAAGDVIAAASGSEPFAALRPIADIRGSEGWKRRVVAELVRATIADAVATRS